MGVSRILSGCLVGLLFACGGPLEDGDLSSEDQSNQSVGTNQSALTCSFYSENFDDGIANGGTYLNHKVYWCDTSIPLSSNTPVCMSGRTLRTNASTIDPTIWVRKGNSSCTGVRINYSYYQYANAAVTLTYARSNDTAQVCEKLGTFSTADSHTLTQVCGAKSTLIPFGTYQGVYVRFEHPSNVNAFWVDNVTLTMDGCSC